MSLLVSILLAVTLWTDSALFDAYRREDMRVWKEAVSVQPSAVSVQTLLYEYGYCGYIVAEAKKEGKAALMPEAKQCVQLFKAHVEALRSRLPKGHYEMYMSAVYVYELRLHESVHPVKAMSLAKEAVALAPDDPIVLSYYGTCLFYAPKPFGSKNDALNWFLKAERLFRNPQWQYCWVREATLQYIHQCYEKTGKAPLSDHRAQRLLIPSGPMPQKGWPAVLLLHDHGARYEKGWAKVIGPNPEPYYGGIAPGDSLAAYGYVVYCIDAPYWGSRRSPLTQRQYSDSLGGAGEWYRRVLEEDKASVTYLGSLPFVDKNRIAAAGFSYGAYRAWNLAAEDKRVSVCLAAHWMTTLAQNRYNDSWLSMCRKEQPPFDEIASQIAPRPFLLQYGTQDKLFPVSAVDSCIQHIQSAYPNPGKFRAEKHSCAHVFTHQHLKNWLFWLKKHL